MQGMFLHGKWNYLQEHFSCIASVCFDKKPLIVYVDNPFFFIGDVPLATFPLENTIKL